MLLLHGLGATGGVWRGLTGAYDGPALIPRVKAELATQLKRDGFASVAAAVGADHKASQ